MIADAATATTRIRNSRGTSSHTARTGERADIPRPAQASETLDTEKVAARWVGQRLVRRRQNAVVTPQSNHASALDNAPMRGELSICTATRKTCCAGVAAA